MKPIKIFLILMIAATCYTIKSTHKKEHARHLTDNIFGRFGTETPYKQHHFLQTVFKTVMNNSEYQNYLLAEKTVALLKKDIAKRKAYLQQEPHNKMIIFNLFILRIFAAELSAYKQKIINSIGIFYFYIQKIITRLPFYKKNNQTDQDLIYNYCIFLQEEIFTHYQKALLFFTKQKKYVLPEMLQFFTEPTAQNSLLEQIHNLFVLKIQAAEIAAAAAEAAETGAADAVEEGGSLTLRQVGQLLQSTIKAAFNVIKNFTRQVIGKQATAVIKDAVESEAEDAIESEAGDAVESEAGDAVTSESEAEDVTLTEDQIIEKIQEKYLSDDYQEGDLFTSDLFSDSTQTLQDPASDPYQDLTPEQADAQKEVDLAKAKLENAQAAEKNANAELQTLERKGASEAEIESQKEIIESAEENTAKMQANVTAKEAALRSLQEEALPESESDLTKKEKMKKYQEEMSEQRAERKAEEDAILKDENASRFKKGWIKIKRFFRPLKENPFMDSLNTGYKAYIFDSFIAPIEDNALKETLESMPTWAETSAHMMMQMSIMSGGGLVATWVSQDDAKIYQTYAKQQSKMAAINTRVITESQMQKGNILKNALNQFKKATQFISSIVKNQLTNNQTRALYLNTAISSAPLPENFIIEGSEGQSVLSIDEMFTTSQLLTPDIITPQLTVNPNVLNAWYDVFRVGKWIYFNQNNTFFQTKAVPINGKTTLEKSAQTLYNTIFKNYVPTTQSSYTIKVECTILKYNPDCFVGIIFNQARWISGIPDHYQQHRFAGIFGYQNTLYHVCEESLNSTTGTKPNTQWPFYRILSNLNEYTDQQNKVTLPELPAKLTFTIITNASQVTVTITDSNNNVLGKISKNNLQTPLFAYHGIGFTAAGCVAQFKITEPQGLTYSSEELKNFNNYILQNQETMNE